MPKKIAVTLLIGRVWDQGFLIKPEQALQVYTVCILCFLGALPLVSEQTGKLTEQH